jgi:hypothetical protein
MRTAMRARRSAARLFNRAVEATALPKWMLAVAIIGAGLAYLTVVSHERGTAAHERSTSFVKAKVPPSAESAHAPGGPGTVPPSSPTLASTKFRFGFLEFEDDPDASTR